MHRAPPTAAHVTGRVAASLIGGYAFVWGFMSLGLALGVRAGADYEEAFQLLGLVAFLVYLGAFCWTYVVPSLMRAWAVLGGGGALMTALAWVLTRSLG
jgi:hypothetical protein